MLWAITRREADAVPGPLPLLNPLRDIEHGVDQLVYGVDDILSRDARGDAFRCGLANGLVDRLGDAGFGFIDSLLELRDSDDAE